jgi:YVTN family beta-propeller protein
MVSLYMSQERSPNMGLKNHRGLLSLGLLLALAPFSASAREVSIYVTDSGGDRVEIIDPTTNKVVQSIGGIAAPHGVGFSPDGSRIYISNESKSALDIVDRASGQITDEVALSGRPNNIAVTKDGGRVLVAIRGGKGGLDVVDAATRRLVETIPVGEQLHNVYVTPDGKYAVAGSIPGHMVTVFDLVTDQPAWEVRFEAGVRPMAIEANPDGSTKRIFVELSEFHGFAIVDFATRKEVERIKLPDMRSESRRGDETTPCHGIAVAPDGKSLWINSTVDNAVFAYSLPDLRLLGHVLLPGREKSGQPPISAIPNWITFTPDSDRLFVSNSALDSVSVIDATAMKQVAVVPVGSVPKRINTLVLR